MLWILLFLLTISLSCSTKPNGKESDFEIGVRGKIELRHSP